MTKYLPESCASH